MNTKYYVFEEWSGFDGGGMDCKEFINKKELEKYILETYKDPDELNELIKGRAVKIICGQETIIAVKEKVIVKEIEIK